MTDFDYEHLTPIQHAYKRPDMYIGNHSRCEISTFSIAQSEEDNLHVTFETLTYSQAIWKLLDEAVVNAYDAGIKPNSGQKNIHVSVSSEGVFCVKNDGATMPITEWPETNRQTIEVLFTEPMSGENFDDTKLRMGGGRNGLGVKVVGIFSTRAEVVVENVEYGKRYQQVFEQNLSVIHPPKISTLPKSVKKSSTKLTWTPDFARFGLDPSIEPRTLQWLCRRAYDISACTTSKVHLNGVALSIKTGEDYARAFGRVIASQVVRQGSLPMFEVYLVERAPSVQIGFVNGIVCAQGTHMDLILKLMSEHCSQTLTKKSKRPILVKSSQLREMVSMVVVARIPNPSFTSQSKERLDTRCDAFGFEYKLSADMRRGIESGGVLEKCMAFFDRLDVKSLKSTLKSDRRATNNIEKYEPPTSMRGKKKRLLWITEGESAKALCVAGFSVIGRETNGVYSLRGKLLNVHGMSFQAALQSKEIVNLTKILEFEPGKVYTREEVDAKPFDRLVGFTDQDDDGSHIMGLLICYVKTFFPSVLEVKPDFICRFVTPILKARIGSDTRDFFNVADYNEWKGDRAPTWVKYYKGLGTSSPAEAKEYFSEVSRHTVFLNYRGHETCGDTVDVFFDSNRAAARKEVLKCYDAGSVLNYELDEISVSDFCNVDLLRYSHADNVRSIPSLLDGLKPSQRKCLFALQPLKDEKRVAQAAAYAADKTLYHHAEKSLAQTIVSMAQRWCGANNVIYFEPIGMFGDIHNKRDKRSAERYIFTKPTPIAHKMFREEDLPVLSYRYEEGKQVEPVTYVPVVANLLINGADGIGSGYKTFVPTHHARDVILCTRELIRSGGARSFNLVPGYFGFTGSITPSATHANTFVCRGSYSVDAKTDTLIITQLPPGRWTDPYKEWVQTTLCVGNGVVHSVVNESTDTQVRLKVKCNPGALSRMTDDEIVKKFNLSTTVSKSLMYTYVDDKLEHMQTDDDILKAHYRARYALYRARIQHQIDVQQSALELLQNKIRFLEALHTGELVLKEMSRTESRERLRADTYLERDNFNYLLNIGHGQSTTDARAQLQRDADDLAAKIEALKQTNIDDLWLRELEELETAIDTYVPYTPVTTKKAAPKPLSKKRRIE